MADKYNLKHPAVKRILQEVKEMQSNPSDDFMSLPLEENIFEWQFAIRGPFDSEFEGGIYHGRIQLPAEYPFKPPSFMLLTVLINLPNEVLLAVRTALVALIAFMPTNPNGALGSLDYKKEERRALAIQSREAPPKFGNPERQKLIHEIHEYMLSKAPPVPQPSSLGTTEEYLQKEEAKAKAILQNPEVSPAVERPPDQAVGYRIVQEELSANANPNPSGVETLREISSNNSSNQLHQKSHTSVQKLKPEIKVQKYDDRSFSLAAIGLTIAIIILLLKKFINSREHGAVYMDGA